MTKVPSIACATRRLFVLYSLKGMHSPLNVHAKLQKSFKKKGCDMIHLYPQLVVLVLTTCARERDRDVCWIWVCASHNMYVKVNGNECIWRQ